MNDTEKLKGLLESIQLSIEEIEGEMSANEFQGGDFNAGGTSVLKYRLEDLKQMIKEFS